MARRIERDSMGEIEIEEGRLWGAQTQRALGNFDIGPELMPLRLILALAEVKKACALANGRIGGLGEDRVTAITEACDAILRRELDGSFPLPVWQSGSGTQTNMNLNEVIANYAGAKRGLTLHPNDDVNRSQSTNDAFSTAMQVAAALQVRDELLPAARTLEASLEARSRDFAGLIKTGRTHLQDAVPMTLGQEFSGYAAQLGAGIARIESALAGLMELPLGGTAVGTGLNAPPGFDRLACAELARATGLALVPAANKFALIAAHDSLVQLSASLGSLAGSLLKLGNDLRLLASGPRCGLGELRLPGNEPGSSIMPGKVNPTQVEALTMVCLQVLGNHTTVGFAGASGQLELNVFKPLIIHALLQSIGLLAGAMASFERRCLRGIEADGARMEEFAGRSLMMVTALSPVIGYAAAARVAKRAEEGGLSLREACLELGLLDADSFDRIMDPRKMVSGEAGA